MSSLIAMEETFGFNKNPLAPPFCKLVIHENPYERRNRAPHRSVGWYIGTAMEHYRCHHIYVNTTRAERVGDTVKLFLHHAKITFVSSAD